MDDLAAWLLEQIAEDEQRAHRARHGYPVTAEDLDRLEPALLTSRWGNRYHEVSQRMTEKPSAEWLERRQSINAAGVVYRWDEPEKVADCGMANVYPARHIATWDPARVLAECDAKRKLVISHDVILVWPNGTLGAKYYTGSERRCASCEDSKVLPCPTLRLLALPYADRPGYQPEWAP